MELLILKGASIARDDVILYRSSKGGRRVSSSRLDLAAEVVQAQHGQLSGSHFRIRSKKRL